MKFRLVLVFTFFAASVVLADDFEDRLRAATERTYDANKATRVAGYEALRELAGEDEDRVARTIEKLDLDGRERVKQFLFGEGFYLDARKTQRAKELLEELSKPVPERMFGLGPVDQARRKLVEEFLDLGPASVATLNAELVEFQTEPVTTLERVLQPQAQGACSLRLKNVGSRALWFLPESIRVYASVLPVHIGVSCVAYTDHGRGEPCRTDSLKAQILDLLALMRRVKPSEEFEYASLEIPTTKAGMVLVTTSRSLPGKLGWADQPLEGEFSGATLDVQIRFPEKHSSAQVFVLEPRDEAPFETSTFHGSGKVGIEVHQTGERDVTQCPQYCWWIAEGADGAVVGKGAFGEKALGKNAWTKDARLRVELDAELPNGTKRVWLGFQCHWDNNARIAGKVELNPK